MVIQTQIPRGLQMKRMPTCKCGKPPKANGQCPVCHAASQKEQRAKKKRPKVALVDGLRIPRL